jgi:hypothetical protein
MSASDEPPVVPVALLTVEGLNYLTTALLYATAQRMGPEFMGEVLEMAEHLRGEREVTIGYSRDE